MRMYLSDCSEKVKPNSSIILRISFVSVVRKLNPILQSFYVYRLFTRELRK